MYGKIFDTIYDGTLVEDWRALITFQQMIVLCDADGIIDMTPDAISRRTSIPIEHIKAGIEILESEDPYSRTQGEGGCRIARLDDHRPWGWFIVNHEKYRNLQNAETVRLQNRERKRRQRAKSKESRDVTDGHAKSRHTDTDTDTNTDTNTDTKRERGAKRAPKSFLLTEKLTAYAKDIGMDDTTIAEQLEGFMDWEFKSARKDWPACWRTWCRRWKKWSKDETHKRNEFDDIHARTRKAAGLD